MFAVSIGAAIIWVAIIFVLGVIGFAVYTIWQAKRNIKAVTNMATKGRDVANNFGVDTSKIDTLFDKD